VPQSRWQQARHSFSIAISRRFAVPLVVAAVILVAGAALWIRIGPRVTYYRERAAYHAQKEAFHRSELEKILRKKTEPDDNFSGSIDEYWKWEHSSFGRGACPPEAKLP
jgi:hypothetical protein